MTYMFPQLKSSLSLEEIEIDWAIDKLCVYSMYIWSILKQSRIALKFFFRILTASMRVQILLIHDDQYYTMVSKCQFILNIVRVAFLLETILIQKYIQLSNVTSFQLTVHPGDFENYTLPLDSCLLSTLILNQLFSHQEEANSSNFYPK